MNTCPVKIQTRQCILIPDDSMQSWDPWCPVWTEKTVIMLLNLSAWGTYVQRCISLESSLYGGMHWNLSLSFIFSSWFEDQTRILNLCSFSVREISEKPWILDSLYRSLKLLISCLQWPEFSDNEGNKQPKYGELSLLVWAKNNSDGRGVGAARVCSISLMLWTTLVVFSQMWIRSKRNVVCKNDHSSSLL